MIIVEFEDDTKKREWGSKEAKCFVCEFGWSESGEPCNNFNEGVGKEGVGNNCPWFKWSSDMFD
ncbi:hypothetical protein [uncultured Clostridium sp.]|uniref:hypothetical protein n=1 Tax=uncultured Clostridium sp. TaxID=59620 RepID=UPI0028EA6A31|nr:hypothetical protein [uncultured Clostridium sp.]